MIDSAQDQRLIHSGAVDGCDPSADWPDGIRAIWDALPDLAAQHELSIRKFIEVDGHCAIQFIWRPAAGYEKWFITKFFDSLPELMEATYNTLEDQTMANIFKVGDLFEYLSAEMLPAGGKDVVMTIARAEVKELTNPRGKNIRVTLYFEETDKGFVVGNKTNAKKLAKLFNTPETDNWVGKRIALYRTNVQAFGSNVDAIRIRDYLPSQEKKAKGGNGKVDKMAAAAVDDLATIAEGLEEKAALMEYLDQRAEQRDGQAELFSGEDVNEVLIG